jgi:hypothetical protein
MRKAVSSSVERSEIGRGPGLNLELSPKNFELAFDTGTAELPESLTRRSLAGIAPLAEQQCLIGRSRASANDSMASLKAFAKTQRPNSALASSMSGSDREYDNLSKPGSSKSVSFGSLAAFVPKPAKVLARKIPVPASSQIWSKSIVTF